MFGSTVRAEIKGHLEGFVAGLIKGREAKKSRSSQSLRAIDGQLKPFHEAMLSTTIRENSTIERSFSTSLGSSFEEVACLIAKDVHEDAERGKEVLAEIPSTFAARIDELMAENSTSGLPYPFPEQVTKVLSEATSARVTRRAISDLYIRKHDGSEWFFEMKSPKPNKGQCLEVTERFLTIHAMRADADHPVHTYFGMSYNPYGSRASYKWTYANKHLDMKNQVLIEDEFWAVIGDDPKTYVAVLEIYAEVGKEIGKRMLDQLDF